MRFYFHTQPLDTRAPLTRCFLALVADISQTALTQVGTSLPAQFVTLLYNTELPFSESIPSGNRMAHSLVRGPVRSPRFARSVITTAAKISLSQLTISLSFQFLTAGTPATCLTCHTHLGYKLIKHNCNMYTQNNTICSLSCNKGNTYSPGNMMQ